MKAILLKLKLKVFLNTVFSTNHKVFNFLHLSVFIGVIFLGLMLKIELATPKNPTLNNILLLFFCLFFLKKNEFIMIIYL